MMRVDWLRRRWTHYGLAGLYIALAFAIRQALVLSVGELPHYITFYPAVMLAALYGGLGPGLVATVLAGFAAVYWTLPPQGAFGIENLADAVGLTIFSAMGSFMSVVAHLWRRARQRLAATERELAVKEAQARAAAESERQRQLLAVTLASIGDAVIVTDRQGLITFLNGEAERLTGWKLDQAVGQPLTSVFKIVNEQTRQTVESPVDKVLRLGTVVGLANHTVLIARDGRDTPIDDSGAPVRSAGGAVHGVVLVFRDITERKRAEEAQTRLAAIVRSSEDAIFSKSLDGTVLTWNASAERMFGYRADEIVGRPITLLIPPELLAEEEQILDRLRRGEPVAHSETVRLAKDGRRIDVSLTVSPLKDAAGTLIGASKILRNITDRKRAEEALRRSERQFRELADAMPQMVWAARPDGRVDYYNSKWCQATGDGGAGDEGWVPLVHPDDRAKCLDLWYACVRTGQPYQIEHRFSFPRSDQYLWYLGRALPVRDESGNVVRWYGTFTDIHDYKMAEQALEAAKTSAERAKTHAEAASSAKDHFLAVLSHELRTPLAPVLATVSMLLGDRSIGADLRENLEVIHRNAELEARLIDDLLDVTRIERGKIELDRKSLDLGTIVHWAIEVCQPDIHARKLEFVTDIDGGPFLVCGDAARLQQVFWNLFKNAIKFTPPGGRISVSCRGDGKGHVLAEVADSGVGIEPEALPRIFNAFEQAERTITRQFGGLGLGLTISRAMVEMHGGTISARSPGKDKGATFTVRLPLLKQRAEPSGDGAPAASVASAPSSPRPEARSLRILLVEDHVDTARVMRRLLQVGGHEVHTAADVATALKLASERTFDLLLSDLGLPDGSGLDLMQSLRARGHTLPGIAISGFGQEQDLALSRNAGFAVHLTKPVSLPQLEDAIAGIFK